MSHVVYRGNLSSKNFPFLAEDWGQTVIMPGPDNTFNKQVASKADEDADVGIPQMYYGHNVMPFSQGYHSVGYTLITNNAGQDLIFNRIFEIRDDNIGSMTYLGVTKYGQYYVLDADNQWVYKLTAETYNVTVCHVQGYAYIYSAGYACRRYDFTTGAFVPVYFDGLTVGEIMGITAAAGYVIAWSYNKIFWSSTLPIVADHIDFVPSLITGAGSKSAEAARGRIVFCAPQTMGFIIYTTENAVAAIYTSNTLDPYQLREIVASGGVKDSTTFAYDANTGNHYVYTSSGLQLISASQSQTIFNEVTDFLSGRKVEEYSTVTNNFTEVDLYAAMYKRLALVADRYVVISYGWANPATTIYARPGNTPNVSIPNYVDPLTIENYRYALVYDLSLKRWGKLQVPHIQCFEFNKESSFISETPKQTLAFLGTNGSISVVDFSDSLRGHSGVLILGKYQYARSRLVQMDEITLENIRPENNFNLFLHTSFDGKNYTSSSPTLLSNTGKVRIYGSRAVGINHSLVCTGTFRIVSVELKFNIHGRR